MLPIRRLLHLAPQNISGVPITFVRAERRLGFESRLITLMCDQRGYEEDICLKLPYLDFAGTRWLKRLVSNPTRIELSNRQIQPMEKPPVWKPHTRAEAWLIRGRERLWHSRIQRVMAEIDFWNYDLYQFDGGLEFYRDGRTIKRLKALGKKVIVLYTGSDLRTRGIIPVVDGAADLRLTLEIDHLKLHSQISHIFFPFEFGRFAVAPSPPDHEIVIGHAPTNRAAKGSEQIIAAVRTLSREFPIRLELIEGLPHAEAIRRKSRCHIFIDNLGELGYGVNAIESLALGICTCTSLMPEFVAQHPDHPFVEITGDNLIAQLRQLCQKPARRERQRAGGRRWAEQHHGSENVVRQIHLRLAQAIDENLNSPA